MCRNPVSADSENICFLPGLHSGAFEYRHPLKEQLHGDALRLNWIWLTKKYVILH